MIKKPLLPIIVMFGTMLFGCGHKGIENNALSIGSEDSQMAENLERWQRTDAEEIKVSPLVAEIRLLNGQEFANTVESLLGIRPDLKYSQQDLGAGFSSGAGLQLDLGLFTSLTNEVTKLSKSYVSQQLYSQYPCLQTPSTSCLQGFIKIFASKAFRRPVTAEEIQTLSEYYDSSLIRLKSAPLAQEQLIARVLLSPQFLYKSEVGKKVPGQDSQFLTDFEIASLISYTLTGDMPDDLLMQAANSGNFSREEAKNHIERLLNSEKSRNWLTKFFQQWLQLDDLDEMANNPSQFPKLASAAMGASLKQEFQTYIKEVVFKRQGSLKKLFVDTSIFINKDTAPLYAKTSSGDEMQAATVDSSQRMGVLTLASVLAVHASSAERYKDKPIKRGLLVYEKILCMPELVPSGINTIAAAAGAQQSHPDFDTMTVRDQHEAMMEQDSSCQAFHAKFMPIGYLFGNFDALGTVQTLQNSKPINTAVKDLRLFADGQTRAYPNALPFIATLAENDRTPECFTEQLSRFVVGRNDFGDLAKLYNKLFKSDELKILSLFEEALTAPELFYRKGRE